MVAGNAFDRFADKILATYHLGPEDFWSAVMTASSPGNSLANLWKHRKIGAELFTLFKAIDDERKRYLGQHTLSLGSDLSTWMNLELKDGYFKSAYPVYAFLAIWMEETGMKEHLVRFGDILRTGVVGLAGHAILDVNVDGENPSTVELLTAQVLIAEYEVQMLRIFGVSEANLGILHRIRDQFLRAEIKEKSLRGLDCPYQKERPIESGFRAVHLLTPFLLSLECMGRSTDLDAYFSVSLLFGAVVQIIDDLGNLATDIGKGRFSYVVLGTEALAQRQQGRSAAEITKGILADRQHLQGVYQICKSLIADAKSILLHLDDPLLERIIQLADLRLRLFFAKHLGLDNLT